MDGELWYKVVGLEFVDVGFLDVVIILNFFSMFGFFFLMKYFDFCGKVRINYLFVFNYMFLLEFSKNFICVEDFVLMWRILWDDL